MRQIQHLSVVFLVAVLLVTGLFADESVPAARNGTLDLSDWDFAASGSVALDGEWAFYPADLIKFDEIISRPPASFTDVPSVWTHELGIDTAPAGYATYRLELLLPEAGIPYALYLSRLGTAYALWIDGRLVARNGTVGRAPNSSIPEARAVSAVFVPRDRTVSVVVQVSNYHHSKGGFRNSLFLGLPNDIAVYRERTWFAEGLTIGILAVMGLYHLFLFLFRREDRSSLYFALLCWMAAVRTGVTNANVLREFLPILDWTSALRIEYLSFFLSTPLFVLFFRTLFPKDVPAWFPRATAALGLAFTVFMMSVDTMVFSMTPPVYQTVIFIEMAFVAFLLVRIVLRGREGGVIILGASLVLFASAVIEAFGLRDSLAVGQITAYSFLLFVFVQSILLSMRFSRAFVRVQDLSVELKGANNELAVREAKYRALFEESKDVIYVTGPGPEAKITNVSPSCLDVLGYTVGELTGVSVWDLLFDSGLTESTRAVVLEHETIPDIEIELKKKNGEQISVVITIVARRSDDGRVLGYQGSVRDLTARKLAEAERLRTVELEQQAFRDPLTRVYNRRYFTTALDKEIERDRRTGNSFSVVLFDVDRFKDVNDSRGHLVGDGVLTRIAELTTENIRRMDLVARLGGDEFIILMPETPLETARSIGERLCRAVADEPFTTNGGPTITVTLSIGVAGWSTNGDEDAVSILNRADQALYQAKEAGRNRVTVAL